MKSTSCRTRVRAAVLLLLPLALLFWPACASLPIRHGWQKGLGPVVPHDTFPGDCGQCHESGSWHRVRSDFTFDHLAQTGVALLGAHADAQCLLCHNDRGPARRFAARGCGGCHEDPHRGKLGAACNDCHDEATWHPREMIARHDRTRFPLVGAHAAVACYRCHPGAQVGNFEGADPTCVVCHSADLARATNPDHAVQGWVADCQRCHLPIAWSPAEFAHPASFPLTMGHSGRRCDACHAGNNFVALPRNCDSCHLDDYQRTTNPPHQASGFPVNCENCHSTANWFSSSFQHIASFPLSGGHAGRRCNDCHASGVYRGLPANCDACHLDEYQRTTNPNHQSAGFPVTCQACHSTVSWRGATFNHRFPINSGPHSNRACADCHLDPRNFQAFSCTHCHDHSQVRMDDRHRGRAGYVWSSPACLQCHPDGRH